MGEDKPALKREKRVGGNLLETKQPSLISDFTAFLRVDLHLVIEKAMFNELQVSTFPFIPNINILNLFYFSCSLTVSPIILDVP